MEMMSWSEVEALQAAGWAVEAHTATHPDLRTLPDDGIREEFERGDRVIEERLGHRPELFAYPYGYLDDRVRDVAASRYRFSVTTRMGSLPASGLDAHRIPRLETYYFRSRAIHQHFGTGRFSAYLAARKTLRRLRHA